MFDNIHNGTCNQCKEQYFLKNIFILESNNNYYNELYCAKCPTGCFNCSDYYIENTPIRIQGTFLSDEEIKNVVDYTVKQQIAKYDETLTMSDDEMKASSTVPGYGDSDATEEPLYNEIVEFVVSQGKASASLLQRRFRLGYNRAARCIDLLEERGIIGPNNGSKPREVLVKIEEKED